jgi:spermidine/putrescine-binding protein
VSYDQNADLDFVDAKDLVTAGTTAITATGVVAASSDTKVTVGTFSGYTAVFVKGYEGMKLSVKLAGKWSVVPSIVDSSAGYYLFKQNTGVGYTADVVVYIDGVEVKRETVVTK